MLCFNFVACAQVARSASCYKLGRSYTGQISVASGDLVLKETSAQFMCVRARFVFDRKRGSLYVKKKSPPQASFPLKSVNN